MKTEKGVRKGSKKMAGMIMKARILYERGVIPRIAKRCGVTEATVRLALRFVTEGEQPDLIRQVAIKEFGCVLRKRQVVINDTVEGK